MNVLVLLGLGADVRLAPPRDPRSGRVREDWLVREVDPASARALELALRLKVGRPDSKVTVVHLGPPQSEPWLRRALAQGADRAIRVWDGEVGVGTHEVAGTHVAAKALILTAAAQAAGFDLVLTGAAGVVDAGGQLGVLLAAQLDLPCVTQVVGMATPGRAAGGAGPVPRHGAECLELTRGLDRGFSERVEAVLPVVATVSAAQVAAESAPPLTTASSLLAAKACEIVVWDLADLGIPSEDLRRAERILNYGRPRPRRPRLRPIAAPDPALPAFDRILKLIEGTAQRRQGRVVRLLPDAAAEHVFRTLEEEGWLDHLRPGRLP